MAELIIQPVAGHPAASLQATVRDGRLIVPAWKLGLALRSAGYRPTRDATRNLAGSLAYAFGRVPDAAASEYVHVRTLAPTLPGPDAIAVRYIPWSYFNGEA